MSATEGTAGTLEHVWKPLLGIRPPGVKRRYYCETCHRKATEREILTTIPKTCGGTCYAGGHHDE